MASANVPPGAPGTRFPLPLLHDLCSHMEWADASVWRAVLDSESARRDEGLRATLIHLHAAQRAFLDVWSGQPFTVASTSDFPDMEATYRWAAGYYPALRGYLDGLGQDDLDAERVMPWFREAEKDLGRALTPTTLGETVYQVVAHTTHHRGQVNTRLRALGADPPLVDYIVWVAFGRTPADWPAPT